MSGIDNNTLLYLRGDSLKDLSITTKTFTNDGAFIKNISNTKAITIADGSKFTVTSSTFALGTKDFTMEFWIYLPHFESCWYPIYNNDTESNFGLYITNSGVLRFDFNNDQSSGSTFDGSQIERLSTNKWYHIAVTNVSKTLTVYINGKKQTTGKLSTSITSKKLIFGHHPQYSSDYTNMSIKGVRLSNIARYTSNFEPPRDIFTSIDLSITNQTEDKVDFNVSKLGQEVINKIEVLVNGQVSKTYDNIGDLTYNIDKSLLFNGNNKIKIKVTFDNDYTEEKEIVYEYVINNLSTSSSLKELIDRQEQLTNVIEVQKNNLKSILESKNVVVSEEENKLSMLIDKVQLLRDKKTDNVYFYKDGDFFGNTFKIHFEGTSGRANYIKETENIKVTYSIDDAYTATHFGISTKIDFNNYVHNNLYVEYETSQLGYMSFGLYSNVTNDGANVGVVSLGTTTERKTVKLPIDNIKGEYYLNFFGYGNKSNSNGYLKIYKIWLDVE